MIIENANKHAETQKKRAERLYQVGNVIECCGDLFFVVKAEDGYALYDLKSGHPVSITYTTLPKLANVYYYPSDKLVTKLTYETED